MTAPIAALLRFRTFAVAGFVGVLLAVPSVLSAQAPLDQAWTILQTGAENKSKDQQVVTMRVLRLIPGDARAVSLAEKALKDNDTQVRGAAALSLGAMADKSAIPQLIEVIKTDKEGGVVLAAAKALIQLGDERGYEVYYAVVFGTRKSGEGLLADQSKELGNFLSDTKAMEKMAFEQGIGFVPFGGISLQVYQHIQGSKAKGPIVKATAIKALAKDPDPRSGKAIVAALSDKEWLIRAAAYDALARRGDAAVLTNLSPGLNDKKIEVKLTAAAAIAYLSTISNKAE